jgi:hypothetical protein
MTTRHGWWFCGPTLRDGRPVPPDGEWLRHDGPLVPCESGLHASPSAFDALGYAPGSTLCEVECEEPVVEHRSPPDKWVSGARRIVRRIDAEPVLLAFARWCAVRVAHRWDAPEIVLRYLRTGDESILAAAMAAAMAATRDASMAAARAAAWAAAMAAAMAATRDASMAASTAPARAAAWDAAMAATRAAAWDAQRTQLARMVAEAFAGRTEWAYNERGEEEQHGD